MDAQEEAEFRDFVAERSAALMRMSYVLTQDQDRAEDLLQDTLAELARRWHRIQHPEAYARQAMYRRQVSWWRHPGRGREMVTRALPDRPVSDRAATVDEHLRVVQALRRLTARQRTMLSLRYLEDLPEAEVSRLLGCTVDAVRSQTHRALARMRRLAPELERFPGQQETPRCPREWTTIGSPRRWRR